MMNTGRSIIAPRTNLDTILPAGRYHCVADNAQALTAQKQYAVQLIRQYLRKQNPWPRCYNEEEDTLYKFVIETAIREIRTADDTPLNVLEDSLRKYDEWAHRNGPTSYIYSIAMCAIDDVIDYLLSAN